jgi:V8-like Glu-specific endopeptidase
VCTGFKVGPDLVATAGHCIKPDAEARPGEPTCGDLRLVFGFRKTKSQASAERNIPAASVYRCVDVLAGHLNEEDWRIIRVDRPIDAPQVSMRMQGRPPLGERLTVVGHPAGLPVTISDGATVQRHKSTFFSADLDTYQGNSGSPVFNSERLRAGELFVEGILVRGEDDFVQESPCLLSRRCPLFSSCRGEDVTYSSLLEPALRRLTRTEAKK